MPSAFPACLRQCSQHRYGIDLAMRKAAVGAALLMKHVQDEAILLLWVQLVTGTMGLYFLAHLVKH